jgi:hypothetical protein
VSKRRVWHRAPPSLAALSPGDATRRGRAAPPVFDENLCQLHVIAQAAAVKNQAEIEIRQREHRADADGRAEFFRRAIEVSAGPIDHPQVVM